MTSTTSPSNRIATMIGGGSAAPQSDSFLARPPAEADSSPLFISDRVEDWLQEKSYMYDGMLTRMSPKDWSHIQPQVDRAFNSGVFRRDASITLATVENSSVEKDLRARFLTAAYHAVEKIAATGLPSDINRQVCSDMCTLGPVVGLLCRRSGKIDVSLNIFSTSVCKRWHRDSYAGRGIVSYTGLVGTMYTGNENVDEWELENCGNNMCIIKDFRQVKGIDLGDMLFIKGRHFPGLRKGSKGLVHKSADVVYHDDGQVLNRLVLKVDVQTDDNMGVWATQ